MHQGLLPHRAPLGVVDVVHLVGDHATEPVKVRVDLDHCAASLIILTAVLDEFVAENLGGADHQLVLRPGRRTDLDVAREQRNLTAHALRTEPLLEFCVLLV